MILKMLDYEQMKHQSCVKESWTYLDNIETARVTYDEDIKETVEIADEAFSVVRDRHEK